MRAETECGAEDHAFEAASDASGALPSRTLNASIPSIFTAPPTIRPPTAPPAIVQGIFAPPDAVRRSNACADPEPAYRCGKNAHRQHHQQERSSADSRLERVRRGAQSVDQSSRDPGQAAARRRSRDQRECALPIPRESDRASCQLRFPFGYRRDEAVAVLGYGFDEARIARIVAEQPPQVRDALAERLVGDRNALPDMVEEAVAGDELAGSLQHHHQRIEIAAVDLDRRPVAGEQPLGGIEHEALECVARHIQLQSSTAQPRVIASRASRACGFTATASSDHSNTGASLA